ncbi:MAG TPA: type II secretion system protein [Planctomycetota bacterium]|jgi:type II secretory pathway pseudopilin PulG
MRTRARGLTLLEVMVLLLIAAVLAGLLLPLFARTRNYSRHTTCSNNLSSIGKGMTMYADVPSNNGYFPTRGSKDDPYNDHEPLAAMNLLFREYVADPRFFSCPSKPVSPTAQARISATRDHALVPGGPFLSPSSCSYGYDPGHKPDSRSANLADVKGPHGNSENHGIQPNGLGVGQNVVFGDGMTEWMMTPYRDLGNNQADQDIYALDPKLPRELDGYIRQ